MGVEPTEDIECPPTELKSAKPTGTYPPPCINRIYHDKIISKPVEYNVNIKSLLRF
jgi:hypothetical protein